MGVFDLFRGAGNVSYSRIEPKVTQFGSFETLLTNYGTDWGGSGVIDFGGDADGYLAQIMALSPARMYEVQPHLRTVINFLARNFAQLGWQLFERVSDTDRQRNRDNVFSRSLLNPDDDVVEYDLKFATLADFLLYDEAYWWITSVPGEDRYRFRRLPPSWVREKRDGGTFSVPTYLVSLSDGQKPVQIPADQILHFRGYSPATPYEGSPAILALKEILAEHMESIHYRNQVWENGGRASQYVTRPADAPRWSEGARDRFKADLRSQYGKNGSNAGGMALFEDGMELKTSQFNAREAEFIEGSKLSKTEVATAYHLNPTMVGILDNASYSNVKEFRRMLYGDTLGPLLSQFEDRINHILLPRLGLDPERFYMEININEKMRGSFDEQSQALQSATGGPYMTRNEARAMQNLPAIEGADELVVPLNVLTGGQASPSDSGSQNQSPTDPVNPPDAF